MTSGAFLPGSRDLMEISGFDLLQEGPLSRHGTLKVSCLRQAEGSSQPAVGMP